MIPKHRWKSGRHCRPGPVHLPRTGEARPLSASPTIAAPGAPPPLPWGRVRLRALPRSRANWRGRRCFPRQRRPRSLPYGGGDARNSHALSWMFSVALSRRRCGRSLKSGSADGQAPPQSIELEDPQDQEIANVSVAGGEGFTRPRLGQFREEHNAVEPDVARVSCACRRPGASGVHRRCWSRYPDRASRSFLPGRK